MNERAFSTTNDSLVENQALNWDITNVFIRYDCKIKDWKNRVYHLRNQTQLKQRDDFFNIIILSHKFPDWIPYFIIRVYLSKSSIICATLIGVNYGINEYYIEKKSGVRKVLVKQIFKNVPCDK